MEKRRIGSLEVSVVGLGCNNFGWRVGAEETKRVLSAALDAGITFLDTADMYGSGESEEFLGNALGDRRKDVILATKFGFEMGEGKSGASPAYVKQAAEASLRRLKTDRIDLYQVHRPDPQTPIADTLGALNKLVEEGKVREIGCSNFSMAQIDEAEKAAKKGARFVSVQNEYSLLQRTAESDVLPACRRLGLAFIPYFPLANGLLTGKYKKGAPMPENSRGKDAWGPKVFTEQNLEIVESLGDFAKQQGHTMLELAVSWLLSQPAVASVIAGAKTVEQVQGNAKSGNWRLNKEELAQVDSIVSHATA